MAFKLMESASKGWRSLNGSPLLAEVVKGTVFIDGIRSPPPESPLSMISHNSSLTKPPDGLGKTDDPHGFCRSLLLTLHLSRFGRLVATRKKKHSAEVKRAGERTPARSDGG
jgi:hypothetical protein